MKSFTIKLCFLAFSIIFISSSSFNKFSFNQDFKGQAIYISKTKMDLGNWGARLSEAQKKQVALRMKNRLEKTYMLNFNKEESVFVENDKLDAISGATDSWGKNFTPGKQYKNIKTNTQIQKQEFYGKQFLVKDSLLPIPWKITGESKKIGQYNCLKASALIPTNSLTWYAFSWSKLRKRESTDDAKTKADSTQVEAWFTPQIPVGHGPSEYWGLPGLILEVSAENTTLLCTKIVLNPKNEVEIKAPKKGTEISKFEYQETIISKMKEFRDNRRRRGR